MEAAMSETDRTILRDLARRYLEIAAIRFRRSAAACGAT